MADLTLYTTSWCGYCRRLKLQLDEAGIVFDEIDIERDPAAATYVQGVNRGNRTVPVVRFADHTTATNPSLAEVRMRRQDAA